jgi:hypothetical protein
MIVAVLALALGTPTMAGERTTNERARGFACTCIPVTGKFSEYVITPFGSPNDPLGRVVLEARGTINAIGTAILASVGPGPEEGTLAATTRHVFVVTEEDQLTAEGEAVFTPIPGSPDVHDVLTLTITGGTGKFLNATGTILATGIGHNFFPLPPGPSSENNSLFDFRLSGELCGVIGDLD